MRRRVVVAGLVLASGIALGDTPEEKTPVDLDVLLGRTDAVAKEVSALRGLPIKKPIPNEVIDKVVLRTRLVKLLTDDPKKVASAEAEGLALQRWGMIPLGIDYGALVIGVLDDQIAGYYDPKTKAMTLVSASITKDATWAEMVLAHELDHALQDQSFDLEKFENLPDTEGDAQLARHALVEGDGIALMIEVLLSRTKASAVSTMWMNPQMAEMIQKEMSTPGGGDSLDRAPLALREAMVFPYRAGFGFVAALRRHQPWSAVDAAFAKPPQSTEQILHPERYLAGDAPVPIEFTTTPVDALPDYKPVHSTVWGEFGFDAFLRTHGVGAIVAQEASTGWGGDRAILLALDVPTTSEGPTTAPAPDARKTVGISRSEWDSEADAIEASEALIRALDGAIVGGSITHSPTKISWLALDGTASWVERRGASIIVVMGSPAWAAAKLEAEVWTMSRAKPKKK